MEHLGHIIKWTGLIGLTNKYYVQLSLILLLSVGQNIYAQRGYAKDSLQIKVYTEIDYKNSKPVKVSVKKVFCDYCSDKQKEFIEEEARRGTYEELYNPKYFTDNGVARLALIIRVSKKDFARMIDDEN